MIVDSDITIYSKYITNREVAWKKTHIKGVHWEEVQGANILKSGLTNADRVKVFIPFSSLEAEPVEPIGYAGEGYTIKPGDYIVKGLVEDEILSEVELEKKYTTAVKVKTADIRKDAVNKDLWHIEIGAE